MRLELEHLVSLSLGITREKPLPVELDASDLS